MERVEINLNSNEFVKFLIIFKEIYKNYNETMNDNSTNIDSVVMSKLATAESVDFDYSRIDSETLERRICFDAIDYSTSMVNASLLTYFFPKLIQSEVVATKIFLDYISFEGADFIKLSIRKVNESWKLVLSIESMGDRG